MKSSSSSRQSYSLSFELLIVMEPVSYHQWRSWRWRSTNRTSN